MVNFLFLISYFLFAGAAGQQSISGVVVDIRSGIPVAAATVQVIPEMNGVEVHGGGTSVMSDVDGRFVLPRLAAGRWRLSATAAGTRWTGPARVVHVETSTPGIAGLILQAIQSGSIAGRVADSDGDPVAQARVDAYRVVEGPSGSTLTLAASTVTDDIGWYTVADLQPGAYRVCVCSITTTNESTPESAGPSAVARARARGVNVVSTRLAFPQRWFPSVRSPSEATSITLGSGEHVSDTAIALARERRYRVSGRVTGTEEPLHAASFRLVPGGWESLSTGVTTAILVEQDGRFTLEGLSPGRYTLTVEHRLRAPHVGPSGSLVPSAGHSAAAPPFSTFSFVSHTASVQFDVADADRTGLAVPLTPTPPIEIALTVDPGAINAGDVRPRTTLLLRRLTDGSTVGPARRGDEGHWIFDGVPPGEYVLTTDSLDDALSIRDESNIGDIVFLVTNEAPALTHVRVAPAVRARVDGVMTAPPEGRALTAVLFPQDPRSWLAASVLPGRAVEMPIDQAGRFAFHGVLTGNYLVAVIDGASLGTDWRQVTRLAHLASLGVAVRITSADPVAVQVPWR